MRRLVGCGGCEGTVLGARRIARCGGAGIGSCVRSCGAGRTMVDVAGDGARWFLSFFIHALTSLTLANWVSVVYVDDEKSRVFHTTLSSSAYVDGARILQCPRARSVKMYPTRSMPMSVLGRYRVGAVTGTAACGEARPGAFGTSARRKSLSCCRHSVAVAKNVAQEGSTRRR